MLEPYLDIVCSKKINKDQKETLIAFLEGEEILPNIIRSKFKGKITTIKYYDESFKEIELTLEGLAARIVQHEYDHIEGDNFTLLQ